MLFGHPLFYTLPSRTLLTALGHAGEGVEGVLPIAPIRRSTTQTLCLIAAHMQHCDAITWLDQALSIKPDRSLRGCATATPASKTTSKQGARDSDGARFDDFTHSS